MVPEEGGFIGAPRPDLGGFGPSSDEQGDGTVRRPPVGITRNTNSRVAETVTINLLPEKEGMFMFQHRNYEVKSARRGSTVVRRYSDFVWLLDCLQKRYPFRQLPLLPPKRVSGTLKRWSKHLQLAYSPVLLSEWYSPISRFQFLSGETAPRSY